MTTFDLPLITFWQRPAGRERVSQQVAQLVFSYYYIEHCAVLRSRVLLFFFFFLPSVFDMNSSLCRVGVWGPNWGGRKKKEEEEPIWYMYIQRLVRETKNIWMDGRAKSSNLKKGEKKAENTVNWLLLMAPVFGWLGGGPAGKLSDLLALWGHVKTPTHQKKKKKKGGDRNI